MSSSQHGAAVRTPCGSCMVTGGYITDGQPADEMGLRKKGLLREVF